MSKKQSRADGDPAVQDFASWAMNSNWPNTDETFTDNSWPEGWGSKVRFRVSGSSYVFLGCFHRGRALMLDLPPLETACAGRAPGGPDEAPSGAGHP